MTTLSSAPNAFFLGGNIALACSRLALPRHLERKLLELALAIVAPATHPILLGRGEVLINLKECAPPKRNALSGGRGHAGQKKENEARNGGAQHVFSERTSS
eukprot:CAMPEP_0181043186 /NCGR_PEP_ID=MMETSP1070-20121207/12568_1 /TAXON_ID=265543 /ORGANISM="Minutocellus polymorphus, Strain NH13" /LENGTH=101 /DNA_ID=CAMNT_0023121487 /DNA_START=319 /DNA_END=624 /DNA_ORIENTATION=-